MTIFNSATPAVEQAPARQILSYYYDGFHHLRLVSAEEVDTNSAVSYYRTVEDFVTDLTISLVNNLTWIEVLPDELADNITAPTEEEWDTLYMQVVHEWIAKNIDLFSANLELAIAPKAGYIARKYVRSSDNWRPTCGGGFVMVRFMQLLPDPKAGYRIAAYGGDDFGLEKDLTSFDSASALYKELTEASDLTVQSLYLKGFARV